MSEEDFNLAANYIQSNHQNFSKANLLNFYAFYKQITVGSLDPASNSKPSFFQFNERAKWEAWYALGAMSENDARTKYINLLTTLKPEWIDSALDHKSSVSGVTVSRPKFNEEVLNEADKTIEDFIRDGNVEKIKQYLESTSIDKLNSLDTNNMGLLHWAADRGHQKILELILSQPNINVNLVDGENQTALHYSSSCGHHNCVRLLLDKGADKTIRDNDGNLCIDVAFDDEIKKLLC